ncbi:YheC/YheD family protein [Bacillus sp. JJ1773]|uniref:YheC/YheD family protein n=1 Tax=Bacillus sp. JJ1773 TaxID=3122965 RepID=UPI002FFF3CA5
MKKVNENHLVNNNQVTLLFNDHINQNTIHLHVETINQLNINSEKIVLHFGAFTKELSIIQNETIEPGKISLSSKLTNVLSIPDLPYDYYLMSNHLYLGPVIGFLVRLKYYRNPQQQLLRFKNNHQINGLIFLFMQSTMNKSDKTIEGYYYDPKAKSFVQGVFPYPSSIFNRTEMKKSTYRYWIENIGENLFNYPYDYSNKWTFWVKLHKHQDIRKHLPETVAYKQIDHVIQMLNKYDDVYLKPTKLYSGKGIFHLKKGKEGYLLTDNKGNKIVISSIEKLEIILQEKMVKNQKYIVQQAIRYDYTGNKVDFRIYLQKDTTKKWKYTAMETKVAEKGSIISSSTNRIKMIPGEKALVELFKLNGEKTQQKVQEITQLCMNALKQLENNQNHFGDAAIDFVIDHNHHVWLLEVNFHYAAEIKANRTADEQQVLPSILPTPFEYAKALAGF